MSSIALWAASWLLDVSIKAALLAAAAWAGMAACRVQSSTIKHRVCFLVLLGMLLLPALVNVLPGVPLPGWLYPTLPRAAAAAETDGKTPPPPLVAQQPAADLPTMHGLSRPASEPAPASPAGKVEAASHDRDVATRGMARPGPGDAAAVPPPALPELPAREAHSVASKTPGASGFALAMIASSTWPAGFAHTPLACRHDSRVENSSPREAGRFAIDRVAAAGRDENRGIGGSAGPRDHRLPPPGGGLAGGLEDVERCVAGDGPGARGRARSPRRHVGRAPGRVELRRLLVPSRGLACPPQACRPGGAGLRRRRDPRHRQPQRIRAEPLGDGGPVDGRLRADPAGRRGDGPNGECGQADRGHSRQRSALVAEDRRGGALLLACIVAPLVFLAAGLRPAAPTDAAEPPTAAIEGGKPAEAKPSAAGLKGRVVMADDGKPVAGAEVRLLTWTDDGVKTKPVTTNAEGQFEFKELAEGRYTLAAYYHSLTSRDKIYHGYEAKAGEDSIVLKLHAAPSLKVKVVARADGKPIQGATVRLAWTDAKPADHLTDASGEVLFNGLTPEDMDDRSTREGFRGGQASGEPERNGDGQRDREAGPRRGTVRRGPRCGRQGIARGGDFRERVRLL